jgi:serine/threonine-protein kinase
VPRPDPYSGAIPGAVPKFQTYSLEVDEMPAAYRLPRSAPTSRRKIAIALLVLSIAGGVLLGVLFLRPKPPTAATMQIQSSPPGARVILDGKALSERTPLTMSGLSRGRSYHIVMELDRYERWDNDQEITQQQSGVRVVAALTPITGTLKVTTIPPGAVVTVNGLNQGQSPITTTMRPQPPPFAFDPQNPLPDLIIEVALDGYKTERRVVAWEGRRTLEVSLPLEPKSR